jgi:hypothetical protein
MTTLDLHNTTHSTVRSKTIRFIESYWDKQIDLKIITGRSVTMQKTVKEVLDEYKLEYRVGDILEINNGYIIIFMGK